MTTAAPLRILVLRYRFIGDTLLTVPFLRALRAQNPQAEITLCVASDGYPLVAHCPYVNHVEVLEPRTRGFWASIQWMKAQGFDRVYLLKRSFSSALMAFLAGIPQRIGFDTDGRRLLLTRAVPYRETDQHEAQCALDLLEAVPADPSPLRLETWLSPDAEACAQGVLDRLPPAGLRVVLHGTSTNPAKCWPIGHFATLAQWLIERHQAQILFVGPPSDAEAYAPLVSALPEALRGACHNLCAQTDLQASVALLKRVQLVVANDSGMVHMASAVQTPLVALFGPMDPLQWGPLSPNATVLTHPGLTCRPCRMTIRCDNRFPCLVELAPEQVYDACLLYLKP